LDVFRRFLEGIPEAGQLLGNNKNREEID